MGTERREMERLAERVELQMEDVKAMVSEIWQTMTRIAEAQEKMQTIETAARYEQKDALDEIREAQKEHTAALQTMNEVMKGALMVMKGLCRE